MFGVVKLYMAMYICEGMTATEIPITWDVKAKSVTYGGNTTLTCNANTCSPSSRKQWFGGPSNDLLCAEDYTANPFKYEMLIEATSPSFDLMIKNFTFSDVDCKYTCVCGLLHFTKMLTLDSLNFIYPPVLKEDSMETMANEFQIDLLMKVYPFPTCTISYQEMNIPLYITNFTTTYKHMGCCTLFDIRITKIVDIQNVSCSGSINLTCKVGDRNYTLTSKNIESCTTVTFPYENNPDQSSPLNTVDLVGILASISIVVLLILTLLWICLMSLKRRRRLDQKQKMVQNDFELSMMLR